MPDNPEWKRGLCEACRDGLLVVVGRTGIYHLNEAEDGIFLCAAPTEAERIAELEAALRPFAEIKMLDAPVGDWDDYTLLALCLSRTKTQLTVGDLRRAKAVLENNGSTNRQK